MPVPLIFAHECDDTQVRVPLWARSLRGIAASLFMLMGLGLAAVGALTRSPDSIFELPAGLGLVASGVLFVKRPVAAVAIYMSVFAGTVMWSLRNLGLGGSSLLYRLVGPMIMLLMILAVTPALLRSARVCLDLPWCGEAS